MWLSNSNGQMESLIVCQVSRNNVTFPTSKSSCPGQPDVTFADLSKVYKEVLEFTLTHIRKVEFTFISITLRARNCH